MATHRKSMEEIISKDLKSLGIEKVKFYHQKAKLTKTSNDINIFTVCILLDAENKAIARGISICSLLDEFNRIKGKNKALGRAVKALKGKEDSCPIFDRDAKPSTPLRKVGNDFFPACLPVSIAAKTFKFKSQYKPVLNSFEKKLVSKPKKSKKFIDGIFKKKEGK